MNKGLYCPVCGSEKIETQTSDQQETDHLTTFSYTRKEHICTECGERGDFTSENDEKYLEAFQKAKNSSLTLIIDALAKNNISMAYVERTLDLSQRTLSRWKSQGVSASGMALMRMIYAFPWLLRVAENNYDETYATKELLIQATDAFDTLIKKHEIPRPMVHVIPFENELLINLRWNESEDLTVEASSTPPIPIEEPYVETSIK